MAKKKTKYPVGVEIPNPKIAGYVIGKDKLTPNTIRQFHHKMVRGYPFHTASQQLRIYLKSALLWLKLGEEKANQINDFPYVINGVDVKDDEYAICAAFYFAVKEGEAIYLGNVIDKLNDDLYPDWKKYLEILERRDPLAWGKDKREDGDLFANNDQTDERYL